MPDKPRPFAARQTRPEVIQYRLIEGPHKELVLDAPPDARAFPAPVVYDPVACRERRVPGSAAYVLILHDAEEFWRLDRSGWLHSPAHRGPVGVVTDNRRTS